MKNKELINKINDLEQQCKKQEEIIDNLNKKLTNEKIKFIRNRMIFEHFIDDVVLSNIDEVMLKEMTNLTYKTAKEEIMKKYDEDIL